MEKLVLDRRTPPAHDRRPAAGRGLKPMVNNL